MNKRKHSDFLIKMTHNNEYRNITVNRASQHKNYTLRIQIQTTKYTYKFEIPTTMNSLKLEGAKAHAINVARSSYRSYCFYDYWLEKNGVYKYWRWRSFVCREMKDENMILRGRVLRRGGTTTQRWCLEFMVTIMVKGSCEESYGHRPTKNRHVAFSTKRKEDIFSHHFFFNKIKLNSETSKIN